MAKKFGEKLQVSKNRRTFAVLLENGAFSSVG